MPWSQSATVSSLHFVTPRRTLGVWAKPREASQLRFRHSISSRPGWSWEFGRSHRGDLWHPVQGLLLRTSSSPPARGVGDLAHDICGAGRLPSVSELCSQSCLGQAWAGCRDDFFSESFTMSIGLSGTEILKADCDCMELDLGLRQEGCLPFWAAWILGFGNMSGEPFVFGLSGAQQPHHLRHVFRCVRRWKGARFLLQARDFLVLVSRRQDIAPPGT